MNLSGNGKAVAEAGLSSLARDYCPAGPMTALELWCGSRAISRMGVSLLTNVPNALLSGLGIYVFQLGIVGVALGERCWSFGRCGHLARAGFVCDHWELGFRRELCACLCQLQESVL